MFAANVQIPERNCQIDMDDKITQVWSHFPATRVRSRGSPTNQPMKGLLVMPKPLDRSKTTKQDDQLSVPTKTELLEVLQHDGSRAGLQLEWMIDRCTGREGRL